MKVTVARMINTIFYDLMTFSTWLLNKNWNKKSKHQVPFSFNTSTRKVWMIKYNKFKCKMINKLLDYHI